MTLTIQNSLYSKLDVAIVGAGMSGLTAAYYLQKKGLKVKVFECATQLGGRMRTDRIGGFKLDRGLHFLHTAYPEVSKLINYDDLVLKPLYQGALIRHNKDFELLANPFKQPTDIIGSLVADVANWSDKLKFLSLLTKLKRSDIRSILRKKDISVQDFLKQKGFSDQFINLFFRPFVGSLLHDNKLVSSSRYLLFVMKMFVDGNVSLPINGIGSIPEQLASKLEEGTVQLQTRIKNVDTQGITLLNGNLVEADVVLIATNPIDLKILASDFKVNDASNKMTSMYFASSTSPISKPIMLLNGENKGLVNNLFVPSLVQSSYAPKGQHLINVSILKEHDFDDDELIDKVLSEMAQWFGLKVNDWEHLKTYHIKYALPRTEKIDPDKYYSRIDDNIYACGDHFSFGSLNSAMRSGRIAAETIIKDIKSIQKQKKNTESKVG